MIANQSTVASLGDAESYLRVGRKGNEVNEADRVDWSTTRNLPTEDSELAKVYMQATAELKDQRVEKPFYTVSVSFTEDDAPKVDRQMMERAADRVLKGLGLEDHEAIIVAHKDKDHPHFHILTNRIHPETGKAWGTWKDYEKTETVLRAFERDHGLTEVSTWKVEPEIQKELPSLPRKSQVAFVEQIRGTKVPDALKVSKSWPELEDRLGAHGLVLQRSGRGLQLTDGESVAKISAIHRKSSLKNLEHRFGETWKEWAHRSPETAIDPTSRRGRSEPAPEVLNRAERLQPMVEIFRENALNESMTSGLERDIKKDLDLKREVDQRLNQIETKLNRTLIRAVKDQPPPTLLQTIQNGSAATAGAEEQQTTSEKTGNQQTTYDGRQTNQPLLSREDLQEMAKRGDTEIISGRVLKKLQADPPLKQIDPAIRAYRQILERPPKPKTTPSLDAYRQHVHAVLKDEHLHGKTRLFRGDDPQRVAAKERVKALPDLLHERDSLSAQSKMLRQRVRGASSIADTIKKKRRPEPQQPLIYEVSRGIPGKTINSLPENAQTAIKATRADTVKIWNVLGPHIGKDHKQISIPKSLIPLISKSNQKQKNRPLKAGALKMIPKPLRPLAKLLSNSKTAKLATTVFTRLMPPQAQAIVMVVKVVAKIARAAAQALDKTLSIDRGYGR